MRLRMLLITLAFLLLAACSPSGPQPAAGGRVNVVATTGMIADVVKNVGGDYVSVTQLIGTGVDPHRYSASESELSALDIAQIIFYNSLGLEPNLKATLEQLGKNRPTLALAESIPADQILKSPTGDTADPHVWMDVELWSLVVQKIADELAAFDPPHAADYAANAAAYRAQLTDLDKYVQDQVNRLPIEQRILITTHDAFQYFGRAYSFEVFAPQNITAAEASEDEVSRTVQIIVDRQIPVIFVENSLPQNMAEILVEGAAGQGQTVEIGGSLYADDLAQSGTMDGTYIGMIRHNVDMIVTALLGLPAE